MPEHLIVLLSDVGERAERARQAVAVGHPRADDWAAGPFRSLTGRRGWGRAILHFDSRPHPGGGAVIPADGLLLVLPWPTDSASVFAAARGVNAAVVRLRADALDRPACRVVVVFCGTAPHLGLPTDPAARRFERQLLAPKDPKANTKLNLPPGGIQPLNELAELKRLSRQFGVILSGQPPAAPLPAPVVGWVRRVLLAGMLNLPSV